MPAADQCCVPVWPGCSSAGQAEAAQGSTGFTICKLVVQSQSHCPTRLCHEYRYSILTSMYIDIHNI